MQLSDQLEKYFRIDKRHSEALERLHIHTIRDLLWHFPARFEDYSNFTAIATAPEKEPIVIEGQVLKSELKKSWKTKIPMAEATIADTTGKIKLVWFHQPYIARMIHEGMILRVRGEMRKGKYGKSITNPSFERIEEFSNAETLTSGDIIPIYPETRGISSLWIHTHIKKVLPQVTDQLIDLIPEHVLETYHLPRVDQALFAMHLPQSTKAHEAARKRFAFEEIFFIQLSRARERKMLESEQAPTFACEKEMLDAFNNALAFNLTAGQQSVLTDILHDIKTHVPMARLLEGDVGSGKTIIAAIAARCVTNERYQVAYMAPTEILARQHFEAFSKLFIPFKTKIGLVTSSECRVFPSKAFGNSTSAHLSRAQLIKAVENGDIKILIGTHSLIQKSVQFKNLGLIVVDEQHRFGVRQRAKLASRRSLKEERLPHFLSMTATPIPRTLALTIFGDLDLSILDELPPGRIPISSHAIRPSGRKAAWEAIRKELEKGKQAYVICPRIEDKDDAITSVKAETKRLQNDVFPEFSVAALHGKLTPKEKEHIMKDFKDGNIHVLVSTSVVEVGVDVPNATVMLVEGAERFGLAQLHQLRGRIGRGNDASTFYALSESGSQTSMQRLKALEKSASGFKLAEADLELRGPGELTGGAQWGISDIGMEALKNIKMVEAARKEARAIIENDPELARHKELKEHITSLDKELLHFE